MTIIRASHLGMCFGVRDAIALALEQADAGPLTVLGDLVHNAEVLADLRARGLPRRAWPQTSKPTPSW
jgi:4-hydroxy-3-methylbut-2-enyl diphosphate reductase